MLVDKRIHAYLVRKVENIAQILKDFDYWLIHFELWV